MIKLINQVNLPSVNFADDFSVTKIKANIFAYGCEHSFLNLWYQLGYNEEITALIERFENNLFIVTKENADFKEIKEFVFTIGFSTIQAKPEIINNLGLNFKEYQVLEYVAEGKSSLPPYPDIKKVYSLLYGEENENIKPTDFEGFYVDLSHKIRKGFAAAITTSNAVCVASHITEDSAVISGVAVQSNNQKSGLGSNILKEMSDSLSGRKIFVAAENSVVPFYIKNGFLKAYKIAIYENEEN